MLKDNYIPSMHDNASLNQEISHLNVDEAILIPFAKNDESSDSAIMEEYIEPNRSEVGYVEEHVAAKESTENGPITKEV